MMKKTLNCLKLTIGILLCFWPSFVLAAEFVVEIEDTNVSANITVDNFSSLEVDPDTTEAGMEAGVLVRLLDHLGHPISNHSVRLYIEGDDTGVIFVQPLDSDPSGEATGTIKALIPGNYKVRAVDDTYGYDIDIANFDMFYTTPLEVPLLLPEPSYTKGLKNTVTWIRELGYEYFVEASKSALFATTIGNSGWLSSSQYTFTGLEDEAMYFYRLKRRNIGGGESNWSNVVYSVQDASVPTIILLSIEDMNKSSGTGDDYIEIQAKIEDNLSLASESTYCVLTDGTLYECATYTSFNGSIYTARISLNELEKDSNGNLLNNYSFCIEAVDEAGNIGRNCDIEIDIEGGTIANLVEPSDQIFLFQNFNLETLTYLPYTLVDNMISTMTRLQISLVSLFIVSVVFFVLLSLYFGNIFIPFLLPLYWLVLLLKKKEYLVEGIIYDSKTKEPLKYAIVKVLNKKGERIGWGIADEYGEFKIDIDEKNIKVVLKRMGYIFPSILVTEKSDYPFTNIYSGGAINFRNSKEVYISIPLDPREKTFLQAKIKEGGLALIYTFLLLLFAFSVFLSVFIFTRYLSIFTFLLLAFNILDVILVLRLVFEKIKKLAIVKNEEGKAVEGITVIVKDSKSGKIKEKRVSDKDGKYYFELLKGEYRLDILNKEFNLIAVEDGREFKISGEGKDFFSKDLIVGKK